MKKNKTLIFSSSIILMLLLIIWSIKNGSINISYSQLLNSLKGNIDPATQAIIDLRLPRIIIALLAGAALAVSGLLLQTSLKNPLIDPSLLGVAGGAKIMLYIGLLISPNIILYQSFFSILGGILAYLIIYYLARNSKSPITIILIGIGLSSLFNGILSAMQFFENSSSNLTTSGLANKSWDDVYTLLIWIPLILLTLVLLSKVLNIFFLDDRLISSLGLNITLLRLITSLTAVVLASIATSVVGLVLFLSLIAPHIAKLLIGKNHIYSVPFTAIIGACLFLLFDSLGRIVFAPIEIPADIIMLIIGGPIFLILIRKGVKYD